MSSVVVTSLQTEQPAVNAASTTTITSMNSQTVSTFVTVQSSTALSAGLQQRVWIAAVLIVVAFVVTYLLSRRNLPRR